MGSPPLRVHDHVRSVVDPDGAVLLDLSAGKYYSLNGVGAEIWQKLEEGSSTAEIQEHLEVLYDVPDDALRRDVSEFLYFLQEKKLVHAAG